MFDETLLNNIYSKNLGYINLFKNIAFYNWYYLINPEIATISK